MERILTYRIEKVRQNFTVKQFLKAKGYSTQNMIELKKRPVSVQRNGLPVFMNQTLWEGDILQIHIIEETSSEHILPVELPLPSILQANIFLLFSVVSIVWTEIPPDLPLLQNIW